MSITALGTILDHLRCSLLGQEEGGHTDGDLLGRFVIDRDEAAFGALLRRHGPMVLSVCQRILRNEADAEDAFQATFLVLVRKAGSIRPRGRVGNWLYGVAHTTALKARALGAKRLVKEQEAAKRYQAEAVQNSEQLSALLDDALRALPEKYRAVIVLCDLACKSIKEAAQHLGCPPGTIGTRLARGRSMLARWLTRRGLTISSGLVATAVGQNVAGAVPISVMASTIKVVTSVAPGQAVAGMFSVKVAALAEGVLKAMFLTKLKIVSIVLLVAAVVSAGAGGFFHYTKGADPAIPRAEAEIKKRKAQSREPADAKADQDAQKRSDLLKLVGEAKHEEAKRILLEAKLKLAQAAENHEEAKMAFEKAKMQLDKLTKELTATDQQGDHLDGRWEGIFVADRWRQDASSSLLGTPERPGLFLYTSPSKVRNYISAHSALLSLRASKSLATET